MKRKIHFLVVVADRFVQDTAFAYIHFDVPDGNIIHYSDLAIEYEQTIPDPIPEAYIALARWMEENHPGKEYRTYYWTLEFV